MNVTILSCFRQAAHYLERYCEQMDGLQAALRTRGDHLKLILGYGDSDDGTGEALFDECSNRFCAHLVDVSHGGPVYGSIEDPQRFRQLAYVGNRMLEHVPADAGVVGIVESDLIWQAETLVRLIIAAPFMGVVAPMVMDGEHSFYDVFAFRRNGVRFTKTPPYHPDIVPGRLVPLDSAGSVLFMRAEFARKARLTDDSAIVGFCEHIKRTRDPWFDIWLDPGATVTHP